MPTAKRRAHLVLADHSVRIMECGNAGTQAWASLSGGMRGLTFELSCVPRQDGLAAQQKMSEVSAAARPRRPAGARQLERLVSPTPCHTWQVDTVERSRSRACSGEPECEASVTVMEHAEHDELKCCTSHEACGRFVPERDQDWNWWLRRVQAVASAEPNEGPGTAGTVVSQRAVATQRQAANLQRGAHDRDGDRHGCGC